MNPTITDIHDIRPVLAPDFRPLVIAIILLGLLLALLFWRINKYLKTLNRDKKAPMYVPGFKELTIKELHTIKTQLEATETPDISHITSRVHHAIKWYLSNKLQKTLTAGTLTEIVGYIPQSFSPILTFCYSVIYPWQKRTRMEVLAFIDSSIDVVKNDI